MTTQYTPTLKLALPVTGELSGTWGDTVNDNITSMIEQAIAGLSTINTWTANAHTLTTANGTTSESRCAMLVAATGGGAPTAAADIICPAAAKLYVLQNNTSFAVTLKTSAGTGVAVAAGDTAFLFCDATNVNSCVTTIVNGNITGNLTVGGNATINGNTTLGNATSDTITATARFNTDLVPSTDNARDLGSAANSWKDLFIDGTATMALVAISGGTINGVSIGATTAATLINVDNLRLDGNTLSSTDTNGNVVIAPNGTGDVQLDADTVRVGDAAAAATLTSNGAGALTVTTGGAADLTLSTNSGTTSGTVVIANGVNGNITLTPDGTGDVILSADRVQMGDSNTDTTLTTNGTGSLNLTTNNGTNSGTVQIAQGVNGNITLTPNGTGSVSISKLYSSGNTILGATSANTLSVAATITSNLLFTDATYDIGASGATRPRDLFLSRNLTVGGTLTLTGGVNLNGNVTVGDSSADTLTINSTITSNLIFTDNTYDIGASGATRPRTLYLGTSLITPAITNSGLTSGRITYAGTGGLLSDSANLTFTSGVLTVSNTGGRSVSGTGTSALFASASAAHTLLIGDQNYAYFQFYTPSSPTYLAIQYNSVEKMRIDGTNGNIGLGGQVPPPNTTYPGIFLPYTTNMTGFGGSGNLFYNIYSVSTQLKWQTSSLGASQFNFGPSSFAWSINSAGGTADTNASLTQYMGLTTSGLSVVGSVTASSLTSGRVTYAGTGGLLQDSANLTFNGTTLTANTIGAFTLGGTIAGGGNQINNVIIGTTTPLAGAFTTVTTSGALTVNTTALVSSGTNNIGINTASPLTNGATYGTLTLNGSNGGAIQFATAGVSIAQLYNDGNALFINPASGKTLSLQVAGSTVASVSNTGLAVTGTLSASTSISTGLYSVPSTNVGIARQASTDALEIKGTGAYTARFNNDTSTSLGGTLQIYSNGVAYASTSTFMVQGYNYSSDFSIANATAQIIGTRMTNDTWNPTLNIVTARQSLTTGSLSFGGIGFSTIDASNSAGMRDGARIAIVNESTSAVASPTAMAFYTNLGSATQTFPATEAGRFNSSGYLLLGTTGAVYNSKVVVACASGTQSIAFTLASGVTRASGTQYGYSLYRDNTTETNAVTFVENNSSGNNAASYVVRTNAATGGTGVTNVSGGVALANGATSWSSYSDLRLKHDIVPITNAIDSILKIDPIFFKWNDRPADQQRSIGVSAQSVEKVFPELIDRSGIYDVEGGAMQVRYTELIPVLLASIQEQQAIINSLKARLDAANL